MKKQSTASKLRLVRSATEAHPTQRLIKRGSASSPRLLAVRTTVGLSARLIINNTRPSRSLLFLKLALQSVRRASSRAERRVYWPLERLRCSRRSEGHAIMRRCNKHTRAECYAFLKCQPKCHLFLKEMDFLPLFLNELELHVLKQELLCQSG